MMDLEKSVFEKNGITARDLEVVVENEGFLCLESYAEEWERISMYFKLDSVDIADIKAKERPKDRRLGFLKTWERKKGAEATYLEFVKALLFITERKTAEEVIVKLQELEILPQRKRLKKEDSGFHSQSQSQDDSWLPHQSPVPPRGPIHSQTLTEDHCDNSAQTLTFQDSPSMQHDAPASSNLMVQNHGDSSSLPAISHGGFHRRSEELTEHQPSGHAEDSNESSSDSEDDNQPRAHREYPGYMGDGSEILHDRSPPRLRDYDSDGKEELFNDAEYNEEVVSQEFMDLVLKTFDSLEENNIAISRLKRFFVEYFKTFEDREVDKIASELKSAESLEEIHTVVTKYYSFYNFDPIERLIKALGTKDDLDNLATYKSCFKRFCVNVYNNSVVCGRYIHGKSKLTFKLNYKKSHKLKGKVMKRVQRTICRTLKIPASKLYLRRIRKGCFKFDYLVSDSVCEQVCELATEARLKMFREHITYIKVYSRTVEKTPMLPAISRFKLRSGFLSKRKWSTSKIDHSTHDQQSLVHERPFTRLEPFTKLCKSAGIVAWTDSEEDSDDGGIEVDLPDVAMRPRYNPTNFHFKKVKQLHKNKTPIVSLKEEENKTLILKSKRRKRKFRQSEVKFESSSSDSDTDASAEYCYNIENIYSNLAAHKHLNPHVRRKESAQKVVADGGSKPSGFQEKKNLDSKPSSDFQRSATDSAIGSSLEFVDDFSSCLHRHSSFM